MTSMATTLDPTAFGFLSAFVRQRSAIVLDAQKSYLIESRLTPIVRARGLASLEHLVNELKKPNTAQLAQEVVEAMTTNETSFFRDMHPFNAMKSHILPELIGKRARERKLTIWSNACSSGQEPYTIAMLLRENFPEVAGWNLKIIATDICTKVLEKAKSGEFNQTEVNRGLPMSLLLKYFTREGMKWIIKDELRNMIDFRLLNLVQPWTGIPPVDIVFLRNVLIYFDVETKQQILCKVHRSLQDDGVLFLGGAESTLGLNTDFSREQLGLATCYRRSKSVKPN